MLPGAELPFNIKEVSSEKENLSRVMNSDTLGDCGYHEGGKVTAWNNMELQKLWCIRKCMTQPKGVTTADSGIML